MPFDEYGNEIYEEPTYQVDAAPPTTEERIQAAFYNDPVGLTQIVADAAAQQRAQEVGRALSAEAHAGIQQFGNAVYTQNYALVDQAMTRHYGDEWEQRKPDVESYLQERPHLAGADWSSPYAALDLIDSAFRSIREDAQHRDDASEWSHIKSQSTPLDGY